MPLRTQLTLAVTALVALLVALSGQLTVLAADHRQRAATDRALTARADQIGASGTLPAVTTTDVVRLVDGAKVRAQIGSRATFPAPVEDGFSTVTVGGTPWRSLARTLVTGVRLQVLVDQRAARRGHRDDVLRADLTILVAALLTAGGVWYVSGLTLRPLGRLRAAVQGLDPADPRLPAVAGPAEIAELTTTLNAALARLRAEAAGSQRSATAARRSAVEAGDRLRGPLTALAADLEKLMDNPDLPATQRHLMMAAIDVELRRIRDVLDELPGRPK
jgi:signal transduction histidine kinase